MRKIRTPSEGGKRQLETETRVQALQRVPGDCAPLEGENRRYRGSRAIAHLWKVRLKRGKSAHLRKVERGSWKQKRGYRRYRGSRTITHLRKVRRKCGKSAHRRKVGRGGWKRKCGHRCYRGSQAIAHLRKVSRKCGKSAHLRKVDRDFKRRMETETRT